MEETTPSNNEPRQTIVIKQEVRKTNGIGTAGFVLALFAVFFGWIPIVGWLFGGLAWLLGLIFSIIGMFSSPRGLAIVGFVVSLASVACLLLAVAGIVSIAMLNA